MHSRYRNARRLLIVLLLLTGTAALYGTTMMFISPDGSLLGMDSILPCFRVLPLSEYLYRDYIFPGIALTALIAIPHIASGIIMIKRRSQCNASVMVPGMILMLWIILQFIILPANIQAEITFIIGVIETAAGYAAFVFGRQECFSFSAESYKNAGKDCTKAVVYFSRLGYTRKLAYEEADRTGAVLLEIKAKERVGGTAGFWWCGRYGMHRWPMPIEHIDLSGYESVTICTPIWVFGVAAPVRALLIENKGKVRNAKIILNHFQPVPYRSAAIEICNILNVYDTEVISVETRLGITRKREAFRL